MTAGAAPGFATRVGLAARLCALTIVLILLASSSVALSVLKPL